MEIYSLVAANMLARSHPPRMDARGEDRYYADQLTLPRPNLRLLGSIAVTVGVILLAVGI